MITCRSVPLCLLSCVATMAVLVLDGCGEMSFNVSDRNDVREELIGREFQIQAPTSRPARSGRDHVNLATGQIVRITDVRQYAYDVRAFAEVEATKLLQSIQFFFFHGDGYWTFETGDCSPLPRNSPPWLDITSVPPSANRATPAQLHEALASKDWAVRHQAIRELARRASTDDTARDWLKAGLTDPLFDIRGLTLVQLATLGPRASPLVDAVVDTYTVHFEHGEEVKDVLIAMGPAVAPSVGPLCSMSCTAVYYYKPTIIAADYFAAYPAAGKPYYDSLSSSYGRSDNGSVPDRHLAAAMLAIDSERGKHDLMPIATTQPTDVRRWDAQALLVHQFVIEAGTHKPSQLKEEVRPLVDTFARNLNRSNAGAPNNAYWPLHYLQELGPLANSALPALATYRPADSECKAEADHLRLMANEAIESIQHGKPHLYRED